MKRLKTLLTALFFVSSACGMAQAYQLPLDRDGSPALNVQDVGVYVWLSTSEVPWLITGSTRLASQGVIAGGSTIAVFGVLTSTFSGDLAAPAFVELRATNTANTTSELLVPAIPIGVSSTTTGQNGVPKNNFVEFNPPIIAYDSLSVNISSGLGPLIGYRFSAAVFYRYLATNGPEDVWYPDDDRGQKTLGGASLYGVKSSTGGTFGATGDRQGTEALDLTVGPQFVMTSSVPVDQSPIMLYGWSASSGNTFNYFQVDDATGTNNYTQGPSLQSSFNFLPAIYPRTFGTNFNGYLWLSPNTAQAIYNWSGFNFPWPIVARRGLRFTASTLSERFRLHTRNRRALR